MPSAGERHADQPVRPGARSRRPSWPATGSPSCSSFTRSARRGQAPKALVRGVPATVREGLRLGLGDGVLRRLMARSALLGIVLRRRRAALARDVRRPSRRGRAGERCVRVPRRGRVHGECASVPGLAPAAAARLGGGARAAAVMSWLAAPAAMAVAIPFIGAAGLGYVGIYLLLGVAGPLTSELLHSRVAAGQRTTMLSVESLALQAGGVVSNLAARFARRRDVRRRRLPRHRRRAPGRRCPALRHPGPTEGRDRRRRSASLRRNPRDAGRPRHRRERQTAADRRRHARFARLQRSEGWARNAPTRYADGERRASKRGERHVRVDRGHVRRRGAGSGRTEVDPRARTRPGHPPRGHRRHRQGRRRQGEGPQRGIERRPRPAPSSAGSSAAPCSSSSPSSGSWRARSRAG